MNILGGGKAGGSWGRWLSQLDCSGRRRTCTTQSLSGIEDNAPQKNIFWILQVAFPNQGKGFNSLCSQKIQIQMCNTNKKSPIVHI